MICLASTFSSNGTSSCVGFLPCSLSNGVLPSSDPEVFVDQVSDLSSSKEVVFFVSCHVLQTDLFLEVRILDDLVQC